MDKQRRDKVCLGKNLRRDKPFSGYYCYKNVFYGKLCLVSFIKEVCLLHNHGEGETQLEKSTKP